MDTQTMTLETYKESMCSDQDYAALAYRFRKAGNKLAEAANRVISEWDGHHRLCIAVSEWYEEIANERSHKIVETDSFLRRIEHQW